MTVYMQMISQEIEVTGSANVRIFSTENFVFGASESWAFRILVPEVRNCPRV
jgi:hypothetical protein